MRRRAVLLVTTALVAMVMAAGTAERPTHAAAPFTVNSTGDTVDATIGDGVCETATPGECTLRAAVQEANVTTGADTIEFNIPDASCNVGVCTISPSSALPLITNPVIINGYSQPGPTPTLYPSATTQCSRSSLADPTR